MTLESSMALHLPSWYLDEQAHAGAEHLDPTYVSTYDAKAGEGRMEDVGRLRDLGLKPESTLVDMGAGTGVFALAAADLCQRVVAVDVSAAMIAALHANLERTPKPNVEPVHAGFLSYQHEGEPADFVYVRHAFHQLPDFWKVVALQHIHDFMAPGGTLYVRDLFYSCQPAETEPIIEAWLSHAPAEPGAGWTRGELDIHLREEHSTYTWLFEEMLRRTGFVIRETWYHESQIFAGYACTRQ